MSRKKNRRKIGRKSLFWTPCSSKTPTLDIAEQFQKNWRKPRKYHALKKIFLILEVSWNNFAEKKLNDHRQFFAVILIEKLGENHRVSNPVVKKMSWHIFWWKNASKSPFFQTTTMLLKILILKVSWSNFHTKINRKWSVARTTMRLKNSLFRKGFSS